MTSPPKKEAALSQAAPLQTSDASGTLRHPGVSIKEASWYFSVHRKTIEKWIKSGKLKVERLPSGRARVILEELQHEAVPSSGAGQS
ncbi:MAG TPA: helix-turn-helix domain-containing protein [Candidatus Methylacidiphilales bacterium]